MSLQAQNNTNESEETKMTRKEVIEKAWKIMLTWTGNYTWDSYSEVFDMIYDFNSSHSEEEEIFFCETEGGYMLEDDYIIVED